MTNSLGIYIHIPFCEKKCNYCNFYSVAPNGQVLEYVNKVSEELVKWGERTARPIDTLYIGGGTPSLLKPDELSALICAVKENFNLQSDAEITIEVNPKDATGDFLASAKKIGVNRISLGVQSSNDDELVLLGRRHNFEDVKRAVKLAGEIGFKNISADIMIGLPFSSAVSLQRSIDDILSLNTEHISAYILKVEKGTPFYERGVLLPDGDSVADQYLQMCNAFKEAGYEHYEVSNFAKNGYESRHNNRYWRCLEYIGIGPSAHSFFEGERFYYPSDLNGFLKGNSVLSDGKGGDPEEFVMLSLRLSRGLVFSEYEERFGQKINEKFKAKAEFFKDRGLCEVDSNRVSLTPGGMLVSNSVILELIGELYENL